MTFGRNDILDGLDIDRRTTLHGLAGLVGTSILGGGAASGQQGRPGNGRGSPQSRQPPVLNTDQRWDEHLDEALEIQETVAELLIEEIAESDSPYERSRDEDLVVRPPGQAGQDQEPAGRGRGPRREFDEEGEDEDEEGGRGPGGRGPPGRGGGPEGYRPFAYCKALGYDSKLGISTDRHADLIEALRNGETDYPLGADEGLGDRPLVSPPAMNAHATEGTDPWLGAIPPAYPMYDDGDDENVEEYFGFADFLDVLGASYYRNNSLATDSIVADEPLPGINVAFQLDGIDITATLGVPPAVPAEGVFLINDWIHSPNNPPLIFRNLFEGCQVGPYVSQHLAHTIPLSGDGVKTTEPTVRPIISGPYGTSPEEFADIRAGTTPGAEPGHEPYDVSDAEFGPELGEERYIHTGLDLASYVRGDPSYTSFVYAARQLSDWGVPLADGVPNSDAATDSLSYVDSGGPAVEDLLARVARNALLAAWQQKWRLHRRLRPESYGERVTVAREEAQSDGPPASAPPMSELLEYWTGSRSLDIIESEGSGNALVQLAYPEGSPASPSYPNAQSVVAGACVTALKTFFSNVSYDELSVEPRVNTDGTESGFEPADAELDVHGELNKLGDNLGMGRIFAGVNYRSDHIYGMLLGEQIAVATLYDHLVSNIGMSSDELTFTTLVGDWERTISAETFAELRQAALDRAGPRP